MCTALLRPDPVLTKKGSGGSWPRLIPGGHHYLEFVGLQPHCSHLSLLSHGFLLVCMTVFVLPF